MSNWRESGIQRSESLEIGREDSHNTILEFQALFRNYFNYYFLPRHSLQFDTGSLAGVATYFYDASACFPILEAFFCNNGVAQDWFLREEFVTKHQSNVSRGLL